MAYDYNGARKAGLSDEQIARYLADKHKYRLDDALKEGLGYDKIIPHLLSKTELKTTPLGWIGETGKRIGTGMADMVLTAAKGEIETADALTNLVGMDDLIESGADRNDAVKWLDESRESLRSTHDPAYEGHWTQFASGLGSMLGFLGMFAISPGGKYRTAFREAKGIRTLLSGKGDAKLLKEGLLGGAVPLQFAGATGAGQAADMVDDARRQGIEVSEGQEDAAIAFGNLIGFTELAPLEVILKKVPKGKIDKTVIGNIMERGVKALISGGAEGVQEMSASLMQDLAAKGIYNPNLQVGGSAWQEFLVGGEVGAATDLLFQAFSGRRKTLLTKQALADEEKRRVDRAAKMKEYTEANPDVDPQVIAGYLPYLPSKPEDINDPANRVKMLVDNHSKNLGQNFPVNTTFGVVKKDNVFKVEDSNGNPYGIDFTDETEANMFKDAMQEKAKDIEVDSMLDMSINQAGQNYSPTQKFLLRMFGRRVMHPKENHYNVRQIDAAAGTTIENGFLHEQKTAREAMALNLAPYVAGTIQDPKTTMTASQTLNANRIKAKPDAKEVAHVLIPEAKAILGDRVGLLADYSFTGISKKDKFTAGREGRKHVVRSYLPLSNDKDGKPVMVIRSRRTTPEENAKVKRVSFKTRKEAKNYAAYLNSQRGGLIARSDLFGDEEVTTQMIEDELRRKNIDADLNSPAIEHIAKMVTGTDVTKTKKRKDKAKPAFAVADLSAADKANLWQKIRSLPHFNEALTPVKLPLFGIRPYTIAQYNAAKKELVENAKNPNAAARTPQQLRDAIEQRAGALEDSVYEKLTQDLAVDESLRQGIDEQVGLDAKAREREAALKEQRELWEADRGRVANAINKHFQRFGLGRVGLNLIDFLAADSKGRIVPETGGGTVRKPLSEGAYQRSLDKIFLAIQAMKANPEYTAALAVSQEAANAKLEELAIGTLNHEILHAMREADLFTQAEWEMLQKLALKTKMPGMDHTYADWAASVYGDKNPEVQLEEAIAEMVRDGLTGKLKIGGKPKGLMRRVLEFIKGILGLQTETGYHNFNQLLEAMQGGELAKRDNRIRSLRETEREAGRMGDFTIDDVAEARSDLTPTERESAYQYEMTLFFGPLGNRTYRLAAPKSIQRERIDRMRKDYNKLRLKAGIKPILQWATLPDQTIFNGDNLADDTAEARSRSGDRARVLTRVPTLEEEHLPLLPIGDIEQSLADLLQRTNGNPTVRQLSEIAGAPTPRTHTTPSGRVVNDIRDANVRPTTLAELRRYMRAGLTDKANKWYDQFGIGLSEIVGKANLPEASVLFGITLQQNAVENNLADTLHIMRVARMHDPATPAFAAALRTSSRPDGQRLKITGDQINRIVRLYREGYAEAGLKTSTYMQLMQDRGANQFNPFSVQDVHMSRVFGFRRRERNEKGKGWVDAAKIPTDAGYRYAQFLTSYLAKEFGVHPHEAQGALWFYAKENLSPKATDGRAANTNWDGSWKSASRWARPEIQALENMVQAGTFNRNTALTHELRTEPARPSNKITTQAVGFSNFHEVNKLIAAAEQRAPTITTTANPGRARGYGFPTSVSLQELINYNLQVRRLITDADGQIPFLRMLGIPHIVVDSFGTYQGLEAGIHVKLVGGTMEQANFAAAVLGHALLQDATVTMQAKPVTGSKVGVVVRKANGVAYTQQELQDITDAVNPSKNEFGVNFSLITSQNDNMLVFIDGRQYDDTTAYNIKTMYPQFESDLKAALPKNMTLEIKAFAQDGNYYDHKDYDSAIRGNGSRSGIVFSPDLRGLIDSSLYSPVWDFYQTTAKRLGFTPNNLTRPQFDIVDPFAGQRYTGEPWYESDVAFSRAAGLEQSAPRSRFSFQRGSGAAQEQGIVLGPRKVSTSPPVKGIHFGNEQSAILEGSRYGTGYRGAERNRVTSPLADPRIRKRVYLYVEPEGQELRPNHPESGVGGHVHTQVFGNILNANSPEAEPLKDIADKTNQGYWGNAFEVAVMDAGYDGYLTYNDGMMVILNHDVPVKYEGKYKWPSRAKRLQGLTDEDLDIAESRGRNPQVDTPAFKKWFKNSVAVDENGDPLLLYHGTSTHKDFGKFRVDSEGGAHVGTLKQATSVVVPDEHYKINARLMPVYVSIQNPIRLIDYGRFRIQDITHQLVMDGYIDQATMDEILREVNDRLFQPEAPAAKALHEVLENMGYDGIIYLNRREGFDRDFDFREVNQINRMTDDEFREFIDDPESLADSYIAFRPSQIKSAIANKGKFNPNRDDISEKRAYHATKEVFDKFSTEHVGRGGHGIQAFGWGLYLSEAKGDVYDYIHISNDSNHVYTVDLDDEAIGRMLDWELPLSKQQKNVKDALKNSDFLQRSRASFPDRGLDAFKDGSALYSTLATELRGAKNASEYLQSIGITGIRHRPFKQFNPDLANRIHYTVFSADHITIEARDDDPFVDMVLEKRAWHGSGSEFSRFRTDRIGSGVGAQVQGYGLYFAEDRDFARQYAKMRGKVLINGIPFAETFEFATLTQEQAHDAETLIRDYIMGLVTPEDMAQGVASGWKAYVILDKYLRMKAKFGVGNCVMYSVEVSDAAIEQMMNWHGNMTEQPEIVKKAFEEAKKLFRRTNVKQLKGTAGGMYSDQQLAKDFYDQLAFALDGKSLIEGSKQAAHWLLAMGVKGTKYSDNSALKKAARTLYGPLQSGSPLMAMLKNPPMNYVVFDENDVTILTRDGEPVIPDVLESRSRAIPLTGVVAARGNRVITARVEKNRLQQFWDKHFRAKGNLPDEAFEAKTERDTSIGSEELAIGYFVSDLNDAMQAAWGVTYDTVSDAQNLSMYQYLTQTGGTNLPPQVKTALNAMRAYIDTLTTRMVGTGVVEEAEIVKKVLGNKGKYLNRSYKAFDDPDWESKIPPEVRERAIQYLLQEHGLTDNPMNRQRMDDDINHLLWDGKAADNIGMIMGGKGLLGAQNLKMMIKREDIAEPIRDLLGEYKDARVNFTRTATKMQRAIANEVFQRSVLQQGMGVFLFDNPTGEYKTMIAGEKSRNMRHLAGKFTSPEIKLAFEEAMNPINFGEMYKQIIMINGLIKYGKTVIAPTTMARNVASAFFFSMANGHILTTTFLKDAKNSGSVLFGEMMKSPARRRYYYRLKQLGVTLDNPYAGEMIGAINDAMGEANAALSLSKIKRVGNFFTKLYQYGDDFWKIIGFESEAAALVQSGMSRLDAEVESARRIRDTYPTYSLVGKAIRRLRRFPLIGTFVSFPAEIIRTSVNIFRLIAADLSHPQRKAIAARRLVGTSIATGWAAALSALSMALLGMDDDDDEAIRKISPAWTRNSNLLYLGSDEDGLPKFVDLSYSDPYNYLKRPLNALLTKGDKTETMLSIGRDVFSPFLGPDIAASAIGEAVFNRKLANGGPVYNPEADIDTQVYQIASHVGLAVAPGIAGNLSRIYKASQGDNSTYGQQYKMADELMALGGLRVTTLNPKLSISLRSMDYSRGMSDAKQILNSVVRGQNIVSDAKIKDKYEEMQDSRQRVFDEMVRLIDLGESFGLKPEEVAMTLDAAGLSDTEIKHLLYNVLPPFVVDNNYMKQAQEAILVTVPASRRMDVLKQLQKRIMLLAELQRQEYAKRQK